MFKWSFLKRLDWYLILAVVLLVFLGLAVIYSTSLSADKTDWSNLGRQLVAFVVGILIAMILARFDYKILFLYRRWIYLLTVIIMILVLFLGQRIRGTTGWFNFGVFSFQPVELAKVGIIVWLAAYFSRQERPANLMRHLIVSGLSVLVIVGLTLLQPDWGSAFLLCLIWFGMVAFIGLRRYQWILAVVLLFLTIVISWSFLLVDYQKQRVMTFFDPSADPFGSGYNVSQAMIAIGSGQFWGRGLGFGSQSQLKFLPEAQTDFAFAVVAEELGFAGVAVLTFLFGFMFYRLLLLNNRARDDFGQLLVLGSTVLIFSQGFLNMAMNLGMAPVAGFTLPFISYGGSALIIFLILLGLIESVYVRSR